MPFFFESLCPRSYGVNGSRSGGYVLFILKQKGAEKFWFRWIQDNVLFRFFSKCRLEHHGIDDLISAQLPEHVCAIHWVDSDTSLANTIASEEGIQAYTNKHCIANKHGAAATACQQSNGLNKIFLAEKGLKKTTTMQHVPSSKHSFKKVLENTFSK